MEEIKSEANINKLGLFSLSRTRIYKTGKTPGKGMFVSSFDSDLLRVTSSAAFRRLQDKTQLFPLEQNDYARTRLTHSCEVSSCGKAIAFLIGRTIKDNRGKSLVGHLGNIVTVCCLLHDIGNPPFGHYGEDVIKSYFRDNWDKLTFNDNGNLIKLSDLLDKDSQEYNDFVNFDGNAQALRVVSKLESIQENSVGLNLTSAVMGGLIKYPYNSLNGFSNGKIGYFKSEEDVISFLKSQGDFYQNIINPIALIMEAADDISMFVSDFEDGLNKGMITAKDIVSFRSARGKAGTTSPCVLFKNEFEKEYKKNIKYYAENIATMNSARSLLYKYKNILISEVARAFINHCNDIVNGNTKFQRGIKEKHLSLIEMTEYYPIIKMSKTILKNKVYSSKNIVLPELKGDVILTNILNHYCESILGLKEDEIMSNKSTLKEFKYLRLISKNFFSRYKTIVETAKQEGKYTPQLDAYYRLRLVVDDVSGMTDSFALTLSKELTI